MNIYEDIRILTESEESRVTGIDSLLKGNSQFRYQMLSRMKSDCDYYLGYGNRNEKDLWANSAEKQLDYMQKIYDSFSDDMKPEWLTQEDINRYREKMLSGDDNSEEYHIENPTVIEDKDDLKESNKILESFTYKSLITDLQSLLSNYDGINIKSNSPLSGFSLVGGKNKLIFDFRTRDYEDSFGVIFSSNRFSLNFKEVIKSKLGLSENNGVIEVPVTSKEELFKEMAKYCSENRSNEDTAEKRAREFYKEYLNDKDIHFKRALLSYLSNRVR